MEEKYTREKDRLARVFEIAEVGDLRLAVAEMKARDDWYVNHMQIVTSLHQQQFQAMVLLESNPSISWRPCEILNRCMMRMNNKNVISLDCVPKLKFLRRKSSTRKSISQEKDNRVRDLEPAKAASESEHLEPELEKMEEKYTREKDRLARVFVRPASRCC